MDVNTKAASAFAEQNGLSKSDTPSLWLCDLKPEQARRFRFNGTITEANIIQFFANWKSKTLKPFWRSGPLPTQERDKVVRQIVSSTFDQEVVPEKDVLVLLKSKYCGYCKKFLEVYEKMAERLSQISTLRLTTIDSLENEVEGLYVESVPALFIYPAVTKNAKERKPIKVLQGLEEDVEKLINLVNQHAHHKIPSVPKSEL